MGVIDTSSELGARADARLRTERTIWLATVAEDRAPAVRPVWFLWDGESFLLYSQPGAAKVRHIQTHPSVALHLEAMGTAIPAPTVQPGRQTVTSALAPGAPQASAAPPASWVHVKRS